MTFISHRTTGKPCCAFHDTTVAGNTPDWDATRKLCVVNHKFAVMPLRKRLTARQKAIVLDSVDKQLIHQPTIETKNRRPMRPNPLAPWELRMGNLRYTTT